MSADPTQSLRETLAFYKQRQAMSRFRRPWEMVFAAFVAIALLGSIARCATSLAQPVDGPTHLRTLFFGAPVPAAAGRLHKPISAHAQLKARIATMARLQPEHFWGQPANTTILSHRMATPIIEAVTYEIDGIQDTAHAYAYHRQPAANCALLLIPGSGEHQAHQAMFGNDYHGPVVRWMRRHCHAYIAIRPLQDADAAEFVHPPHATLNEAALNVALIPHGTTAHTVWAIRATAIALSLQERYGQVGILGLSQGATMAAIISTAVRPCLAVLASGFTTIELDLLGTWNWNAAILIQNINDLALDALNALNNPSVMLAYGLNSRPDAFSYDGSVQGTCSMLPDATCTIGQHGHSFPPQTRDHLSQYAGECR